MRQHALFKQRHPDCVLFFRMGDFYELFHDDAHVGHQVLNLTLTQRTSGIPMAGVPAHAVDNYVRKLIDAGHRVAVCDQVQDPADAKGVVQRAVTRVLTPGTLVEDELLEDAPATLAAAAFLDTGDAPHTAIALAIADASTGDFTITPTTLRQAPDILAAHAARELLIAESADTTIPPRAAQLAQTANIKPTPRPAWHFRQDESLQALKDQYRVASLAGFGLDDADPIITPAAAIVRYLRETHAIDTLDPDLPQEDAARLREHLGNRSLNHLKPPRLDEPANHLILDAATLRALEIERTVRDASSEGSLLALFNSKRSACRTAIGRRLLRDWLCRPLRDIPAIEQRQRAIAALVSDRPLAAELADQLQPIQDVPRITARLALDRASPRDLAALARSLRRATPLADILSSTPAFDAIVQTLRDAAASTDPIADRIDQACVDNPPAHLRDGGLIRDNVDPELDQARALQQNAAAWLADYQAKLSADHDLPSLKVGFNKVFGYYIELPRAQAKRAPDAFTRKQTLTNAERYITPELKSFEDNITSASERALARERAIFKELCDLARSIAAPAATFAYQAATLDALACFADRAAAMQWTQPTITTQPTLQLQNARHPVLEESLQTTFVPNHCTLGSPNPPLSLITGPNMAGKSTYIRQIALLTLLAHTGSSIPADQGATVGLTDRIFTRVGADDALHRGQSTFMVEMSETANILNHATDQSLVILDEIGRGTSTLDGLSLAWAIAEFLANSTHPSPRTLFATHYHEITDLAQRHPEAIANFHVAVREWGDDIVFLHQIAEGPANRSFGVHVAKLAGIPTPVIARAKDLLDSLAVSHAEIDTRQLPSTSPPTSQLPLFTEFLDHPALKQLRELKLDHLSPLDAFDALRALQRQAADSQQHTQEGNP